MCVNNLPGVALDSGAAGIRTRDLLIASPAPYHYATEPHEREDTFSNKEATKPTNVRYVNKKNHKIRSFHWPISSSANTHSRSGWVPRKKTVFRPSELPKDNIWEMLGGIILHGKFPSGYPTNSIRSVNGR